MPQANISPAEQLKRDIESARSDLKSLIEKSKLASARSDFSELDADISNMAVRIQTIRGRNYAFQKILESQALEFQKQWTSRRSQIQNQITMESNGLQTGLRSLEFRTSGLSLGSSPPVLVKSLQHELDAYNTRITASEQSVSRNYIGIKTEVSKVKNQLYLIEKALDLSESAKFGFFPTESLVMAVKSVWTCDNKEDNEDPEGILFLTDQRLLFEQREEVATKKVLFVTTERRKIQNLLFEVPVLSISSVTATKQGVFKNEDWLDLDFESGAFARSAKLHLDGQDSAKWQKLITQVKTGEMEDDRALAIDQLASEKVKAAPTKCPNCGGLITKPVLRGMDTITCDFCGTIIRL